MIVSQSDWGAVRVRGADRVRFLQGMCMGNVEALAPGGWLRTATLDVKGRLLSIYDAVKREDEFVLCCQPGLVDATIAVLGRHAIMDDVSFEAAELPIYRRWPDPASVWTAAPLFDAPDGPIASVAETEIRRVEGGLPLYGIDCNEKNFPFETPLASVIDYKKGCYVGQEPVARVYSKGQPSKQLRGLELSGVESAGIGAAVDHPDKSGVGSVTSSVVSPTHGAIALCYLARGYWDPGTQVTVAGRPATVVSLPFCPAPGSDR